MAEPLNKVTILYKKEHEDIANLINTLFIQKEIPSSTIDLSIEVVLKSNNENLALREIENSTLIIPVRFPIQKTNKEYSGIRHFYENIGNLENVGELLVFPVYMPNDNLTDYDENDQDIRKPRTFFKNTDYYQWNSSLSSEENIQIFKMRFDKFLKRKDEYKKSTSAFTKPTIEELISREKRLKFIAYASMIIGFAVIVTAIIFVF